MKFITTVTIAPKDNSKEKEINMLWEFGKSPCFQYGHNACATVKSITHGIELDTLIDLRYSKSYEHGREAGFMWNWCNSYWSGEDGAWRVKSFDAYELVPVTIDIEDAFLV